MLISSKDMFPTPLEWVERESKRSRYVEIDRGGHFLEWGKPEIVAGDIQFLSMTRFKVKSCHGTCSKELADHTGPRTPRLKLQALDWML
jgi:hypothetical protein